MLRRMIILLLFTLLLSYSPINAQEISDSPGAPDETTISDEIEYQLAYPGILPGHPLYKLKVLRDKIQIFLISTPDNRINFYLRQADKGIFATLLLAENGNDDLAAQTALKAEHNVTLINSQINGMSEKPDLELFDKLKTASLKHQETLASTKTHLDEEHQKTIDTVIEFSQRNLNEINRYESITPDRWSTDK